MSREHELISRLRERRKALAQARNELEDAKLQLAGRKEVYHRVQAEIDEALEEIETGRSSRPVLDVIERNGQAAAADPPETADEQQRGSTSMRPPPAKPKPKTERADRREVVISPNGPNRQEINLGSEDIQAINARLDEVAAADPKRKTFAVYVRDPVTHKPARGLGYVDAASKDKALAMATKRWPAIKPTELLISPPGWEQSPPPADGPERPKPLRPDPDKEWADDAAQGRLERTGGEPDPTVSQWAASVPVPGVKGAREFLGSFLATDEEDALAVARARWPGRPDLEVRRAGPPAAAEPTKPKARKAAKAGTV